ncbi:ABC transporter ATP-binding protein [Kitasatospora indigofera]|uniref:ABC transporter ATP-binding protein n=1 Tax=Kitasatospora indigofera TaxID=67307 RepID=UPI0033BB5A5E
MIPVAEVDGLRVEVGGRMLLDGVSLRVHPGRVTALLGASGSGKTTTGLALLGEYPDGARVDGLVRVAEGAVGYIPQHPASVLNPARRVGALLRDVARRSGGGRAEVIDALRSAQLPDAEAVLRRFPHELSGGQQQRVVLAQALLLGAGVVVADEPTTGQDVLTKQRIVDELSAVVRQGIGLLLLSHDLDVVRELADETVVLRGGRVVESGPAGQLTAAREDGRPRRAAARRLPIARKDSPTGSSLHVRGLTARHPGGAVALQDVGLSVDQGECLALVGRSGSGKTTLGRCLSGLHSAYKGQVVLDGSPLPRSLRNRNWAELGAVQYVFQDAQAAFADHRPVVEQVARAGARLRGLGPQEARRSAVHTLAELGLSAELAARRPGELSGGEVQRAALARALVVRPRFLVCDEVTSGLDTVNRSAILDLLAGLLERSELALVFITHDLPAAVALADRIAILDKGSVVEQAPTAELLASPRHPFTRLLLSGGSRFETTPRGDVGGAV